MFQCLLEEHQLLVVSQFLRLAVLHPARLEVLDSSSLANLLLVEAQLSVVLPLLAVHLYLVVKPLSDHQQLL